jgi:hypothetical protein
MPLNSLQPPNKRKLALLTAAFLLLVLAGAGMAMGENNFAIRSLAVVAGLASLACVRRINVHTPPGSATEAPQRTESSWATRLRRPMGIIAVLLIAFAGAALAMGGNDVMAMVAISTSVVCIRLINVHTPSGSATEASQRGGHLATLIRHPIGIISLILVPIMAMASFLLYRDAVQGYHQSWPLYLFFWTGFICSLCWAYFVSMFFGP